MSNDAPINAGAAAYRGFLFSDMRGFTAFAERYGNSAAATMVGRFLEIARNAIAHHDGAEIKTEGDAIHAVFPSASGAVMCGLEIVDAAAELSAREPDRPLRLGVGVHAGEAVETAEGYIGTAVNLAARVCAVAQPGEVLVTSTVKGITQASIPVGYIARGRRRLKGITEPVEVFAVSRDVGARAPRRLPRPVVLGAAGLSVAVLAAIAVAAASFVVGDGDVGAKATPTSSPQPLVMGPLSIGTYRSQAFQPPVTFAVLDLGWAANRDRESILGLLREAAPRGSVYLLRVSEVIADPCVERGEGTQTGRRATDLVDELQRLAHVQVENRQPVDVGGSTGEQVDVTISEGALAACGGLVGGEVALFEVGDEVWRATPGERFRLLSLDVGDEPVTAVLSTEWSEASSVQELEDLLDLGERILASVRF